MNEMSIMNEKKVLIAEDELAGAILLKSLMVKEGYSVTIANNGHQALDIIKDEDFDLVLTDWMMPEMDGIELIHNIRRIKEEQPLIIMITALVSKESRFYALDSGADDFVTKPIDIDDLKIKVKEGILRKNKKVELSTPPTGIVSNSNPPFPAVSLAFNTGGPSVAEEIFSKIDHSLEAVYFIIYQSPSWMIEAF